MLTATLSVFDQDDLNAPPVFEGSVGDVARYLVPGRYDRCIMEYTNGFILADVSLLIEDGDAHVWSSNLAL